MDSIRLLLIEDDREFSEILQRRFQRRGLDVVACESPEEARKLVEKQTFDVAIVDGTLRGRDGVHLVQELRRRCLALRCIMLSGDSSEQAIARAKIAGASAYLFKPCSLLDIEETVKQVAMERIEALPASIA